MSPAAQTTCHACFFTLLLHLVNTIYTLVLLSPAVFYYSHALLLDHCCFFPSLFWQLSDHCYYPFLHSILCSMKVVSSSPVYSSPFVSSAIQDGSLIMLLSFTILPTSVQRKFSLHTLSQLTIRLICNAPLSDHSYQYHAPVLHCFAIKCSNKRLAYSPPVLIVIHSSCY